MPYANEFAHHKVLGRFTESEKVKQLLESCKEPDFPDVNRPIGMPLARSNWSPRDVLAIDGSHREIPFDRGYPGAEISFVSVANVLINVEKLLSESRKPTIDPVEFNHVQSALNLAAAFPSSNMITGSNTDARSSFRAAWNAFLAQTRPGSKSETLLETYQALFQYKETISDIKCPLMDLCSSMDDRKPDFSCNTCACGKYPIYLTDALRIHERFTDTNSNGESFGEVMRVTEHLLLIACLRHMERICSDSGDWSMFAETAVVMDGSLAVFGHPAWLSRAIKQELSRINVRVREHTGNDMLVFGIEKSGKFFDHWCRLDTKSKQDFQREILSADNAMDAPFSPVEPGRIPKQSVLLLDDAYIKKYIVPSESEKPHGKDTYYGRPFLYKTSTGAMIVGISAILSPDHDDRTKADITQFPRLADTLDLLDLLVSMRYPNAVIPLIAAHAEAAIPLQMGEKVLDKLARDHVRKMASME